MSMDHRSKKQVTITTGPIYVPPINIFVPNDKLIVTLKNPTHKKLQATVTLGLCPSPDSSPSPCAGGGYVNNSVQTFEVNETDIHLGTFKVDPMTCLRIERTFDNFELFDSVIRITATGDFEICKDSCQPICGLLEISSVVGFSGSFGGPFATAIPAEMTALYQAYYTSSGVLGTDEQTHVRYAEYVLCDTHCPCDSDSDSSSSSSSSSSDGHY
ncbi:hypothetical protein G5B47_10485 [Paenibacillus sp. 7124]|uniref:Uncharacterized protein n=1 Tax=Paenibacillus apii TaxID=1850370 RepID=A0A6M1PI20_9BACL|nr:hypothetical protein [Paenibacillus apii]NGM82840.1 hypothetical protein [Paenibacillus apii]